MYNNNPEGTTDGDQSNEETVQHRVCDIYGPGYVDPTCGFAGNMGSIPIADPTEKSGGDSSRDDDMLHALEESTEDWKGADSSFMVGHFRI